MFDELTGNERVKAALKRMLVSDRLPGTSIRFSEALKRSFPVNSKRARQSCAETNAGVRQIAGRAAVHRRRRHRQETLRTRSRARQSVGHAEGPRSVWRLF